MRNKIIWCVRLNTDGGHIETNQNLELSQIQIIYPYRQLMANEAFKSLKMDYENEFINIRKYPNGTYPITFELWHKLK